MITVYSVRKFLPARRVFRTARQVKTGVENVFLVLSQDKVRGFGEASPNRYFGVDAESVHLQLSGLADFLRRQTLRASSDIARIGGTAQRQAGLSPAACCALDTALWDLWGKLDHRAAARILWAEKPVSFLTSVTLSASCPEESPEDFEARLEEVRGFPCVKVKLDASGDLTALRRLRAVGVPRLRVDANASWTPDQCRALLPDLRELGVEALEQPLPPELDEEMMEITKNSPLPVIADESCVDAEDVRRLAPLFSGVNIKLVKCGGLTAGVAMLRLARQLGLKIMVGCMLESSVLIAAGLALAQSAEWADLDGQWLLAADPFAGLGFADGQLMPSEKPGLGVRLRGRPDRG